MFLSNPSCERSGLILSITIGTTCLLVASAVGLSYYYWQFVYAGPELSAVDRQRAGGTEFFLVVSFAFGWFFMFGSLLELVLLQFVDERLKPYPPRAVQPPFETRTK